MTVFIEAARPKINLTLRILGRRADGYHVLQSLVAFADAPADAVTLDTSMPVGVAVSGPFAGGIAGANLLQTVLELVAEAAPSACLGHLALVKNLPVAAGIGGGSADAAAALRALRRANPELATNVDWWAIALRLGADVPVCLEDRPAWMSGIGERIEPLEALPVLDVVLANPLVPVPADKTAQVFRALGAPALASADEAVPAKPRMACRDELVRRIDGGNDLEAAARQVVPAIGAVLESLRAEPGCRVAAMSGAGPTCFGMFDDAEAARAAAASLAARHPAWWVRSARFG